MLRWTTVLCCLLLCLSQIDAQENPDVDPVLAVRQISVDGLKQQNEALVLGLIDTQVGKEISSESLSRDIRTLYRDTGLFSEVTVDVTPLKEGGLHVKYLVVENPKMDSDLNIVGNDKLSHGKLKSAIKLLPGGLFNEHLLAKTQKELRQIYLEEGFYLAELTPEWDIDAEANTVSVRILVEEGERVKVSEVDFAGNDLVLDASLEDLIQTRKGKRFRDAILKEDLNLIREHYHTRGLMQVELGEPEKQISEDRREIRVIIPITEGPQYFVGNIKVDFRNTDRPGFSEEKIRKMLRLEKDSIFDKSEFQKGIEDIQIAYSDKGYILASIDPIPGYRPDGTVDIELRISEGSVTIIDKVQITGLEKTKSHVIQRELGRLDIRSGEVFNVDNLRKAHQKIRLLGSFIRSVDFMPSLTAEGDQRDLLVQIVENTQTGIFTIGGGYGTEGGVFGVAEIGESNLFGRAYRVHLKGELGTRDRRTAQLQLSSPWILGTPTHGSLNLYNLKRQRRLYGTYSSLDDRDLEYVDERYGASIQVGRPVSRDFDLSLRFKDESAKTELPPLLQEDIDDYEPDRRETRSLTFTAVREAREYRTSYFDPVGGSYNSLSLEHSGGILGGDNEFDKMTYDTSWFFDSFWKFVFVAHVRTGYLRTRDDPSVLYWERYVLGGIDTVRGYEDFSLLPDPQNPEPFYIRNESDGWRGITELDPYFGGNKMYYLNLEYRFPITDMVRGIVFFDMGQVWNEHTPNIFDEFKPKKSVGAGVRFDLFGMLARLEYGYGLDREVNGESAPAGKFHFTIGPAF